MKKLFVLVSFFLLLVVIVSVITKANKSLPYETTTIKLGEKTIMAEIANTKEKRELGLSGRRDLLADRGMLFVFDKPGVYGFWMKGMNFPIDIIWLDANHEITGKIENVPPDSFPEIFYSPQNTLYVLELRNNRSPNY